MTGLSYVINADEGTCFPVDMDTSKLIDVTPVGARWRQYVKPDGGLVDCASYYEAARQDLLRSLSALPK